jgi:glycosyltransferase involved in cell wall biosynthesis
MSSNPVNPVKVMIFGTHPKQFNGYSKVVYELCKELTLRRSDVSVSVFGFQNFHSNDAHRNDLDPCIDVYDAFANENPKSMGFGIGQVADVVTLKRPQVIVVYNDLLIITQVLQQLKDIKDKWFRVILYIDQVYLNQKREFIEFINQNADAALAFTPSWRKCIVDQGLKLPCDVLEHGINPDVYFPIPKRIARKYFNLAEDDFMVLNLNRNQPRKRWDTCIKAYAHVAAGYKEACAKFNASAASNLNASPGAATPAPPRMIKFIIGTALTGGWDILEIYQRELEKRGMSLAEGLKHLVIIDNPQKLTDQEINVLYNVSDCGINTADGEGVGLCSVEAAVIGIPQIVPRLGGFVDFFDDECAILVEPRLAYYVDATRDMVQGEALMCDYSDFADAIMAYYGDEKLCERHGKAARKKILEPHRWGNIADHFVDVVKRVHSGQFCKAPPVPAPALPAPALPEIPGAKIQDSDPDDVIVSSGSVIPDAAGPPPPAETGPAKKLKKKKKSNKVNSELQELKQKLDALLALQKA